MPKSRTARGLSLRRLTAGFVRIFLAASVALFLIAAAELEPPDAPAFAVPSRSRLLCVHEAFTWRSQSVFGLCLALAPGSAVDRGQGRSRGRRPPRPGGSLWTAGFDILYALQDEEHDRRRALRRCRRVGTRTALTVSPFFTQP